jgi:predicted AAA+ superfamily ATPase
LSTDELGRQLGLSKNTVEKYLDILSKVFAVFRLGAYARNLRKEVVKAGNGISAIPASVTPLSAISSARLCVRIRGRSGKITS